jgi:hypothetical protein
MSYVTISYSRRILFHGLKLIKHNISMASSMKITLLQYDFDCEQHDVYVRSEVFTAVKISIMVFWVTRLCCQEGGYQHFRGIYIYIKDRGNMLHQNTAFIATNRTMIWVRCLQFTLVLSWQKFQVVRTVRKNDMIQNEQHAFKTIFVVLQKR